MTAYLEFIFLGQLSAYTAQAALWEMNISNLLGKIPDICARMGREPQNMQVLPQFWSFLCCLNSGTCPISPFPFYPTAHTIISLGHEGLCTSSVMTLLQSSRARDPETGHKGGYAHCMQPCSEIVSWPLRCVLPLHLPLRFPAPHPHNWA